LCHFLAGARNQELGFTKQQFFIDGLCTFMTQVIPVMAVAVYISYHVEVHLESYQVCGFMKFEGGGGGSKAVALTRNGGQ
jgi:hypothetical protein